MQNSDCVKGLWFVEKTVQKDVWTGGKDDKNRTG